MSMYEGVKLSLMLKRSRIEQIFNAVVEMKFVLWIFIERDFTVDYIYISFTENNLYNLTTSRIDSPANYFRFRISIETI